MKAPTDHFFIAIVDDEPALREATENLLKSAGFRAQSFASAEDFLQSESPRSTRCLVLDARLPGMSGLDLQRYLALAGFRIPIVFISAQEDSDGRLEAQAVQAGALAFLHKPFGEDEFLTAVQCAFVQT